MMHDGSSSNGPIYKKGNFTREKRPIVYTNLGLLLPSLLLHFPHCLSAIFLTTILSGSSRESADLAATNVTRLLLLLVPLLLFFLLPFHFSSYFLPFPSPLTRIQSGKRDRGDDGGGCPPSSKVAESGNS